MAKYDPLRHHLEKQGAMYHGMSFDEIADLVDGLPPSAFRYREWWSNEEAGTHVQAQAWMKAGWAIESLDLRSREVAFRRRK